MSMARCPEHGPYVADTSTDFGETWCPECGPERVGSLPDERPAHEIAEQAARPGESTPFHELGVAYLALEATIERQRLASMIELRRHLCYTGEWARNKFWQRVDHRIEHFTLEQLRQQWAALSEGDSPTTYSFTTERGLKAGETVALDLSEGGSTEPEEWKCDRCGSERWETRDIGQIYCQDCGTKGGIAIAG